MSTAIPLWGITAEVSEPESVTESPLDTYLAWATDLGVSGTGTDLDIDGDDAAPILNLSGAFAADWSSVMSTSTEGGFSLYPSQSAVEGSRAGSIVTFIFGTKYARWVRSATGTALLNVVARLGSQADLKTVGGRVRRSQGVTLLYADLMPLSGSTTCVSWAARIVEGAVDVRVAAISVEDAILAVGGPIVDVSGYQGLSPAGYWTIPVGTTVRAAIATSPRVTATRTLGVAGSVRYGGEIAPFSGAKQAGPERTINYNRPTPTGYISGTVKEKSTPDNVPLRRLVRLHRETDGGVEMETWSDAVTGAYLFERVNIMQKYTVIAYDYVHNYRAVIADNVTPSPM